jgi:nicotinate-nucleotide adenylyltransferase
MRLDRILFVPVYHPPHKHGRMATYRHRLAMTRLAIQNQTEFELCRAEETRPGPSYTVDTLRELQSLHPEAMLYLILGSDQYRDVASWHQPGLLTDLAHIVVMSRPGERKPPHFPGHNPKRIRFCSIIPVSISAAAIRARLAKGHSIRYMLPVGVAKYVRRHRPYRSPSTRRTA